MRHKSNRFSKSIRESVSIRIPSTNEELPKILDKDGNAAGSGITDSENYTFLAKVIRASITQRNPSPDPHLYQSQDAYYVHFDEPMDFIKKTDEILWHAHIEKAVLSPTIRELQDTYKGVLTVESVERHRGRQRIFCRLYTIE